MAQLMVVAEQVNIFILILARILGVIMTAPVVGSRNIPPQLKIGLSAIISLMVYAVLKPGNTHTPDNLIPYILLVAGEVIIGLAIGFVAQMFFTAIQLAGQAIDMQMGFSIVNVIDPMQGNPIPMMGNFKYIVAVLLFLVTNSHHLLFAAILKSFEYIPIMSYSYRSAMTETVIQMFGGTLATAIKICLPVVGVLLITDMAMGILARTVPQMNIFVVGMPLKIIIGLVMVLLSLPLLAFMLKIMFDQSFLDMIKLIRAIGG